MNCHKFPPLGLQAQLHQALCQGSADRLFGLQGRTHEGSDAVLCCVVAWGKERQEENTVGDWCYWHSQQHHKQTGAATGRGGRRRRKGATRREGGGESMKGRQRQQPQERKHKDNNWNREQGVSTPTQWCRGGVRVPTQHAQKAALLEHTCV